MVWRRGSYMFNQLWNVLHVAAFSTDLNSFSVMNAYLDPQLALSGEECPYETLTLSPATANVKYCNKFFPH
jgi:hypothetical protein